MGGERSESAGERPKFFTPGMIAVLSLFVLVVLLLFLRFALVASARRAVERELAAARASGYATTFEELAPPPVRQEENAAPMLEMAAAMFGRTGKDTEIVTWFDSFGCVVSEEDMKAALDRHAEALRLAREALLRTHYRFERDYDDLISYYDLPNLVGSRILTGLLLADSLLKARGGRRQESVEALFEALDFAGRIGSDPPLISKMVGLAMAGRAPFAIEQMNREGLLDDGMRRAILERLGRGDILPPMDTLFVAELAFASAVVEDLFGERCHWGLSRTSGWMHNRAVVNLFNFVYLNEFALTVRGMREAADAGRLPPWEFLSRVQAIQTAVDTTPKWKRPLYRLYGPHYSSCAHSLLHVQSLLDAARVGLALELYRSANDDYPDGLDALVPDFLAEVSKDPFTGKDLVYTHSGDDVTVSSVGRALVYDPKSAQFIAWKTKRPPRRPRPSRKRRGKKQKAPESTK